MRATLPVLTTPIKTKLIKTSKVAHSKQGKRTGQKNSELIRCAKEQKQVRASEVECISVPQVEIFNLIFH